VITRGRLGIEARRRRRGKRKRRKRRERRERANSRHGGRTPTLGCGLRSKSQLRTGTERKAGKPRQGAAMASRRQAREGMGKGWGTGLTHQKEQSQSHPTRCAATEGAERDYEASKPLPLR
jgi:hypothetical protein